jgi:hypothetical protein
LKVKLTQYSSVVEQLQQQKGRFTRFERSLVFFTRL